MTQPWAESEQVHNGQSLSASLALIFPILGQKSAKAAVILLKEHHLTTLKNPNMTFAINQSTLDS